MNAEPLLVLCQAEELYKGAPQPSPAALLSLSMDCLYVLCLAPSHKRISRWCCGHQTRRFLGLGLIFNLTLRRIWLISCVVLPVQRLFYTRCGSLLGCSGV